MNGMTDVRLTLYQRELLGIDDGSLAPRGPAESRWRQFWRRVRTRRQLLELSDEQLRDIGISREQARIEALRPFWRC
ncbi:DUF1127 domain-containing protein [Pseudomonas sp. R3.Fl]|jgi:uncharacterized protein YjiS (DUF1127 family)|uniref:YjiS-like domain-containing protein n=1 Tax=Pseudomonas citronellolis TaxID=53408 RepID=A0A127N1E4_9PSED|nr:MULTISPECIES: DUF1127 domain-containing protein [Pseudomonas]KSW25250.1 hypothetical protein AOX63_16275 [Pseudomonas sp. ADP]AMO79384.1 hypothetical protein PcP3B5_60250 [Pseudomonas citronellolis]ANI18096.1 hypothetical protein A9C11_30655 [Pseudomonas citronellolis]MCL6690452.1 DUF1127 domain-containing protein [Pseudomonas sp. R3.Fl]OBP07358.1 hypothetical protein BAE52_30215 [Pseudomonas sp. EGD-AKN5]